jgi:hypothetical protein
MAYVQILKFKKNALKVTLYKGLSRIDATFGRGVTCS